MFFLLTVKVNIDNMKRVVKLWVDLGYSVRGTPLMVDITYGGLLVVGDHGAGKTFLLERCKESLIDVCDLVVPDAMMIRDLCERMSRKNSHESLVVLVADDFDRLGDESRKDLLDLALRGHLAGIHVIASTSETDVIDNLALCAFRNIVSFRVSRNTGALALPDEANSLIVPGEGIFMSTMMKTINFKTIIKMQKEKFYNQRIGHEFSHGLGPKGKRTSVIGGSFNCDKGPNNEHGEVCPNYEICTDVNIKDSSRFSNCPYMHGDRLEDEPTHEIESGNRTYSRFAKYVSELCDLNLSKDAFWDHVVFTNYVQFMLPKEDSATAKKTSARDAVAFQELMDELDAIGQQPEIIIVWGVAGEELKHDVIDPEMLKESEGFFFHRMFNGKKVAIVNCSHPDRRWRMCAEDRMYEDKMLAKYLRKALDE